MQQSERGINLEQGEVITLIASAARTATAGTNGTAVTILGERKRYIFILAVTAAATDVDDTLDAYIDWSVDGTTYYNGGHFTQVLGNGGAKSEYMVFDATTPGVATVAVAADQASGAVLPSLFGAYVRLRYVIVNAGAANASFTFSLTGYAI
jgi:hypothetical protein